MSRVREAFLAALAAGKSQAEATAIGNAAHRSASAAAEPVQMVEPEAEAPADAPVEVEAIDTPAVAPDLDAMDKDDLLAFVRDRGVDVDGRTGVVRLREMAAELLGDAS